MTTTTFELVHRVLNEMFPLLEQKHGKEAVGKAIRERSDGLSSDYGKLGSDEREEIDYSSPLTRFAYVYTYVTAHSSWTADLLADCDEIVSLLKSDSPLRATFLGGGPGSELIGLIRAAQRAKRKESLACFLLDREDGWAETWAEVDQWVDAAFKLSTMVRKVDVCNPPNPENLAKVFSADLFFAIYFLSEVHSFAKDCDAFFENMIASMKSGAYVVCIDNSADVFTKVAKKRFPSERFELVHDEPKITLQLSPSEEKKMLGEYLDIVGRQPRLKADASRFIWRKK